MKYIDFTTSGNSSTPREKTIGWINGTIPLPDIYYIGKLCRNKHGINGKSVRYVKGDACVVCGQDKQKRAQQKKNTISMKSKNHRKAMDIYDDIHNKQDGLDPFNDLMNMEL